MPSPLRKQNDLKRKAQTRVCLLDAAAKIFARSGYHPPRIADIVAEAGVGQGTFYRHFASKRAALDALFDRFFEKLLRGFAQLSDHLPEDQAAYREASLDVVRRLTDVLQAERELVLLFLRQGPAVDAAFEEKMSAGLDRFADLARFYLDHAIAQGFARPCRSDLVAQALVGMALRMVERWLSGRLADQQIEAAITELVDFAFFGFCRQEGEKS